MNEQHKTHTRQDKNQEFYFPFNFICMRNSSLKQLRGINYYDYVPMMKNQEMLCENDGVEMKGKGKAD